MINNLELIKPLLQFKEEGDFYQLYIFKRKKDQPEVQQSEHQSVRTIKTYSIDSLEYLDKRWDEITHLCEYFKARAYIHVQCQNHKDVALDMLIALAGRVKTNQYNQRNLFDSIVGQIKTREKLWIVDIDSKDEVYLNNTIDNINTCRPFGLAKIVEKIPTKSGYHLITYPFDLNQFGLIYKHSNSIKPDVQRKNPTILYIPSSILNN